MKLSPHLVFNGQCHEAFSFYEQALVDRPVNNCTYKWSSVTMVG